MYDIKYISSLPEEPYKPLADLGRIVSAQGSVLLKNEGNMLPLAKGEVISLFGRTQIDYLKSGAGSGGLVRVDYVANILEGIRNNPDLTLNEDLVKVYENWIKDNPFDAGNGWATEPWYQVEMVPDEALVADARSKSDIAVIVIGRTAGEDKDNSATKGSWYLTDDEEALLDIVSKYFKKTVVLLNVGNIIDMKWVEKYNIKSVMYIWQGGQDGGNAVADLLSGNETPCGKLADTIAKDISLYPGINNFGSADFNIHKEDIYIGYRYFETFAKDDVLYPFGFGLSYTSFEQKLIEICQKDGVIALDVEVSNIGSYSGREVVQLYYEAPQGLLGKPLRELCSFAKTKVLSPGEKEILHLEVKISDMSSYDDGGITGNKSCYVLESGEYKLYMGSCVRCAKEIFTHAIPETQVTQKCTEVLAPVKEFDIMHPLYKDEKYEISYKKVSLRTVDYNKRIQDTMPKEILQTGDKNIKLIDVKNGKYTMEEFVAQLSDVDLMCLLRGEGMCSPKVRPGSAGAVGGTTEALSEFGIPVIGMHDGPSGIRMDSEEHATALPNGACIASTWDTELAKELYANLSIELCTHKIDSILGPGINIHRVPLNGRNFEYFSEDPYISGKIAAALVDGVATYGNSATIKHFALNYQEYCRRDVDAVVSERAVREIYLKSFEIPVREAKARSLMTSYNLINGVWCANNYELNTIVLRDEWGYEGFVVTDWWPKLKYGESEFSECMHLTNLVEAQNDVYMVVPDALNANDNIAKSLQEGKITLAQLQRNAMNVIRYVMNSHSFDRFLKYGSTLQRSMADFADSLKAEAVIEAPKSQVEYDVTIINPGRRLLCIEYSSNEAQTSQMTINVTIDGKNNTSVTVNGTNGNTQIVYRDMSISSKNIKVCAVYSEKLIEIKKIEIK